MSEHIFSAPNIDIRATCKYCSIDVINYQEDEVTEISILLIPEDAIKLANAILKQYGKIPNETQKA